MKKLFAILAVALVLTGCNNKKTEDEYKKLEDSFVKDVTTYYEENILGTIYPPFSCQKITIEDMKNAGISVNEYVNKSCDASRVSAVVVVTDDSDPENIKYEVVANLSCDDYTSTISDEVISKYQCISTYMSK